MIIKRWIQKCSNQKKKINGNVSFFLEMRLCPGLIEINFSLKCEKNSFADENVIKIQFKFEMFTWLNNNQTNMRYDEIGIILRFPLSILLHFTLTSQAIANGDHKIIIIIIFQNETKKGAKLSAWQVIFHVRITKIFLSLD